jgi:Uma2 family endonuclease
MVDTKRRRATYQDVLDAPEHMVAEIFDGELVLAPRPAGPHSRVHSLVMTDIGSPFDRGRNGPGGWIILIEPELHLDADICVPDVAGWRRERLPVVPQDAYFTLPPNWVCEVLSASTEKYDRGKKLRIYARAGIQYAWFVSPRTRMLEVMRRHEDAPSHTKTASPPGNAAPAPRQDAGDPVHWLTIAVHTDDEIVRAEPFDAIELDLGAWWRDIAPPTRASESGATIEL